MKYIREYLRNINLERFYCNLNTKFLTFNVLSHYMPAFIGVSAILLMSCRVSEVNSVLHLPTYLHCNNMLFIAKNYGEIDINFFLTSNKMF